MSVAFVLSAPCPIDVQPMDFGHAEDLMARAETEAQAFLAARATPVVPLRRRRRRNTRMAS